MTKIKLLFLMPFLLLTALAWAQAKPKETIKEFVTKIYIHGLPYEQGKAYGKAAVPELTAMLKDKAFEHYWPNVVVVLGYIGDAKAVKPLMEFVEGSKGEISLDRFRAILRVFQALGHISQSGDSQSMNTLLDYTSLQSWKARNLQFKHDQYSGEILSEVLARQAIVGLGISGRPEAMKKINELKQSKSVRKDWQDNLDEARTLNQEVRSKGAGKVFGGHKY